MQNGLCGKRPQGLGFRSVPPLTDALFQSNFTAARRLPASDKFRSNMQVNSKYYDTAWRLEPKRASAIGRGSLARRVREVVAGGTGRAIFPLPLGHWRFSVKGSYSSFIEDEDG
jgi:hypothetical protein